MKRRTILCMPILGLFSSLSYSANDSLRQELNQQARIIFSDLSSVFSDIKSAASIGEKYLLKNPELNNSTQLLSNLGFQNNLVGGNPVILFEKQRADDYRYSNTINLDGWVLSKAEVSLCCAASILLTHS